MSVAIGTQVKTQYGVGKVNAFREENSLYTIELTSWKLSNDQSVFVFCQEGQFSAIEPDVTKKEEKEEPEAPVTAAIVADVEEVQPQGVAVGAAVKTQYGVGKIVEIRDDSIIHVELTEWFLSDNQKVHVFLQESQLTLIPQATESPTAVTGDVIVAEVDEEEKAPKVVKTQYGTGIIVAYRPEDDMFHIELTSWTLSEGQKVHCFLQSSQFKVIDKQGEEHVVDIPAAKAGKEKGCCTIM